MSDYTLRPAGAPRLVTWVRRLAFQAVDAADLMGRAAWRATVEVTYSSDDLTHAASIAYYALLSFLPFLLLGFAVSTSLFRLSRAGSRFIHIEGRPCTTPPRDLSPLLAD